MSELNDFLKVLSEGKKQKEQRIAAATESLSGFLGAVAEAKAQDPKHQMLKEVKKNVREDIADLFSQLAQSKPVSVEKIDQLVESVELIEQIDTNVVGEFICEDGKFLDPVTLTELVVPEVKPAAEIYTKAEIDDLLKRNASFQQPDPKVVDPTIPALQQKLKFLEQAVGRIAAAGPGSGEVNFRWLDDTNRATMTDSNDNWVLEYDATTKKVQFTENIGPIRTIKFNTAGTQQALVPGQMAYNADEDCFDFHHNDGTTLQGGLEQHIRVHNHLGTTVTNGTVVQFAGVENTNDVAVPIVGKYVANSSASPLYIIGVLTTDIIPNGVGRATAFGYVRNLNTTGADVGETWLQGDLLWAHPSLPGKMTKVRPTAPNVATSIAAVVRLGTTDGQILVRPTIWPRLYYGDWFDTTNQTAAATDTAYPVRFNSSGAISGFELVNNTDVKALNAGRYNFEFSFQFTSSNSSLSRIYIWYRKNGVDVPNSATIITIAANGGRSAPAWNFPVLMNANDTFTLMWATNSTSVSMAAEPASGFHPSIPSIILTVSQTNL